MRRRIIVPVTLLCLALVSASCSSDDKDSTDKTTNDTTATTKDSKLSSQPKPEVSIPDGPAPTTLQSTDITVGTGAEAKAGDMITVNYVGVSYSTKEEFDASYDSQPFSFALGSGSVIKGWDQGVAGMKIGGRRQLIIPPDLGYGANGAGPIKPNETLVFVIDLLEVN